MVSQNHVPQLFLAPMTELSIMEFSGYTANIGNTDYQLNPNAAEKLLRHGTPRQFLKALIGKVDLGPKQAAPNNAALKFDLTA